MLIICIVVTGIIVICLLGRHLYLKDKREALEVQARVRKVANYVETEEDSANKKRIDYLGDDLNEKTSTKMRCSNVELMDS